VRIAFIGFGEAARAFRTSLAEADPGLAFACYDILYESEGMDGPTARAAVAAGVEAARTPRDAAAGADWVFSAVTAASSLEAAAAVAGGLRAGQVLLDINSVSPARKQATAALVGGGASYVDMAVMAPAQPNGHRAPVLLSGRLPEGLAAGLDRLGFRYQVVGEAIGGAAAVKLARSVFVKGLEAITVEALLAAEAAGCLERVAASLAGSFPGLGWPGFAAYQFERSLTHGRRRAAEMRESGAMLDELGLDGGLARAIAAVQERMGASPEAERMLAMAARIAAERQDT
jgi:3-hydroxyisobutyrate dehydrogenase-like beta-hydroxyacid dehydrogenase